MGALIAFLGHLFIAFILTMGWGIGAGAAWLLLVAVIVALGE